MQISFSEISCENNRDAGDLANLMSSITATNGKLLQPILLAPSRGGGRYEVIDGRRRFAALQQLGREFLDDDEYIIRGSDLDHEAAAYIANTERKMLSPLEETKQICDMLKTMTSEEIAEKLGKTLNYVVSRSRLAELSGIWQQVLADPEKYPQWTIGKLQMIAREPAATQKEIEHLVNGNYTLSELWTKISYYHRQLSSAPFSWQNFCRVCEKRSDRQGVLFDEDQTEAVCLDSECYTQHCFNFFKKKLKENPALKPVRNGSGYGTKAGEWADKNKIPPSWQYEFTIVDNEDDADGIICCGEQIGKLVKIKNKQSIKTSADNAADKKSENAKKAEIKKQREILRIAMQDLIDTLQLIKSWKDISASAAKNVWGAILSLGINGASYYNWNFPMIIKPKQKNPPWQDMLLEKFIDDIITHISYSISNPQLDIDREFEQEICKVFEIDWKTLFIEPAQIKYETTKGK